MIDYNDSTHTYSSKGVRYISATQLIERYEDPFNLEAAIDWCVYKRGGTREYWRQAWKEENKKSLIRGNSTHDAREEITHTRQIVMHKGNMLVVPNPAFLQHLKGNYYNWPDGAYPERILWNHHYKVAGRTDMAIFTTRNGVRYASILDYKTNKKIRKTAYQDRVTGTTQMLRSPLDHLENTNYNKYTLQLSLYALMLEMMGFTIEDLVMEHIPHPDPESPDPTKAPKPVITNLIYRKEDVYLMLEHYERSL